MRNGNRGNHPAFKDYGGEPFVFNIDHATEQNTNFRTALWTGQDMQLTLMSIPVGGDIGLEMHEGVDQFLRIEKGCARVYMGPSQSDLRDVGCVNEQYAIIIPSGTWHNIVNVGSRPLKLYSLYAPPQHPFGTIHRTKEDAEHEGN